METLASLPTASQNDAEGIVKLMKDEGCAIIPNLLTKEKKDEMINAIDSLEHLLHDNRPEKNGNDHFKCVFNRDPYWLQFIDLPGVIDAVENLMGSDCHIIGMSAWRTPPGHGGFNYHVDQLMFNVEEELLMSGKIELPVYYSTLHFYLNDMTEDLCPTWVIPGSHKSGRGPGNESDMIGKLGIIGGKETEWNGIKAEPVLVNAGDGMLFRSELWHSGSKNTTTDKTRYMLQVHYGRRGVAQRFPPYLEFKYNPEVLKVASERQLRLLGKHHIGAYG